MSDIGFDLTHYSGDGLGSGAVGNRPMEILIAEDDYISRNLLKRMLTDMGHQVVAAENGRQALEVLRKRPIKFLVTDWMMPEMDGLELCRSIRGNAFDRYIYIIVLTAKDSKKDLVAAFQAGADDYIPKPFDPEELKARVSTGLRVIEKDRDLETTRGQLALIQNQMMQSEKMAAIGQLTAGVAHEINNPTSFVDNNLKTLSEYQLEIATIIGSYRELFGMLKAASPDASVGSDFKEKIDAVHKLEQDIKLDFLLSDINDLIGECREGSRRIIKIVSDLKWFVHPGEDALQSVDVNAGLTSTLNVVHNEIKYRATVETDLGEIPMVNGYAQQLNQVFMNLLINAAQAMEKNGRIDIKTYLLKGFVEVTISDTGRGIPMENIDKIFEPFFTTKEVGKGTGLGMYIVRNIIEKHHGTINVQSEAGEGTTFIIRLPAES